MDIQQIQNRIVEIQSLLSVDKIANFFAKPSRDFIDTYLKEFMFAQISKSTVGMTFPGNTPSELVRSYARWLTSNAHDNRRREAQIASKLKISFEKGFDEELLSIFFPNSLDLNNIYSKIKMIYGLDSSLREVFKDRLLELECESKIALYENKTPLFHKIINKDACRTNYLKNKQRLEETKQRLIAFRESCEQAEFILDVFDCEQKRTGTFDIDRKDHPINIFTVIDRLGGVDRKCKLEGALKYMQNGIECFSNTLEETFAEEILKTRKDFNYSLEIRTDDLSPAKCSGFTPPVPASELPNRFIMISDKYDLLLHKGKYLSNNEYVAKATEIYVDIIASQAYANGFEGGNKHTAQHMLQKLLIHKGLIPPPVSINNSNMWEMSINAYKSGDYGPLIEFLQKETNVLNDSSADSKYILNSEIEDILTESLASKFTDEEHDFSSEGEIRLK